MKNKSFRIHISYSDRHFHPEKVNKATEWFSCSQIANRFFKVLKNQFGNVTYGDKIPDVPIDLLWTNQLCPRDQNVARMATFASVAHYSFVTRQVRAGNNLASCLSPQGQYSLTERWHHWRTLSQSDLVLAIGNDCIAESFSNQNLFGEINVIDCGVDTDHFTPCKGLERGQIFVHNATRFSVRKGSHLVAEAWRRVFRELPNSYLLLLGKSGDVDMEKLLEGTSNVIWIGEYQSGSKDYIFNLSRAKWSVLPSLAEGQAGTLLEAMSCGCVPIASLASGINAEQYFGYQIDPFKVDSIVMAMLLADKEWSSEKSLKVRCCVEKINNWGRFESQIENYSRKLINNPIRKYPSVANSFRGFLIHLFLARSHMRK